MHRYRAYLLAFVAAVSLVAVGSVIVHASPTAEDALAGPSEVVVTTSSHADTPTTETTINFGDVQAFLVAWSDSEKAAAYEAFESERLRLEAEAEAQRQAEAEARRQEEARRAAEAQAAEPAPAPDPGPGPAQYGSGACGGDLPPCYVMMRESGGNITAQNPTSTASGKWQFLDSTWGNYMGYAKARYAPEWVQDQRARELWAGGAGCSHWSAC